MRKYRKLSQKNKNTAQNNSLIALPRFYLFNLAPTEQSPKVVHWIYVVMLIVVILSLLERSMGLFGFIENFVSFESIVQINEHQTFIQEGLFNKTMYISDSEKKVCILVEPENTLLVQIKNVTFKFLSK